MYRTLEVKGLNEFPINAVVEQLKARELACRLKYVGTTYYPHELSTRGFD
jgi:hypothetical protein